MLNALVGLKVDVNIVNQVLITNSQLSDVVHFKHTSTITCIIYMYI